MKIVKYLVARFIFNIFSINIWLEILEFIPRTCIRSRLLVRKQEHDNKRERAILGSVQFLPHIFHIINHKNRKRTEKNSNIPINPISSLITPYIYLPLSAAPLETSWTLVWRGGGRPSLSILALKKLKSIFL